MELNKIGYILACIGMILIFVSIIFSGSIEADMENNPEDNKSVNNYQNYAQKLSEGNRSFIETKKAKTKSTKKRIIFAIFAITALSLAISGLILTIISTIS